MFVSNLWVLAMNQHQDLLRKDAKLYLAMKVEQNIGYKGQAVGGWAKFKKIWKQNQIIISILFRTSSIISIGL